jgi:RimJ/RimL family protein N-acetyltransferase
VIQALDTLRDSEMKTMILAGGSNPHIAQLKDLVKSRAGLRLEIDALNVPDLMAWADIAVSAAGSTSWEMCMLGLPAIVTDAAGNQRQLAGELNRKKIAIHIPLNQLTPDVIAVNVQHLIADSELRSQMSARGRKLVEGRGAHYVVAAMKAHELTLRRTTTNDCSQLWKWANDPEVRQASFSSCDISREEHNRWFAQKVQDERCTWLMFEDRGVPVATVRIQATTQTDGEISVTVSSIYRGQGLAPCLLERAVAYAFTSTSLQRVHALIKTGNGASSSVFESAGFLFCGRKDVRGCDAHHYICERDGYAQRDPTDDAARAVGAV